MNGSNLLMNGIFCFCIDMVILPLTNCQLIIIIIISFFSYDIVSRSIHGCISEYLTTVNHFAYGQDLAHEFLEIQRKLEAFPTNMFE